MSIRFPSARDVVTAFVNARLPRFADRMWPLGRVALAPTVASEIIFAAVAAPTRKLGQHATSLRALAPALNEDVRYIVAETLRDGDLARVEQTHYDRSSPPLREERLAAYAAQIPLTRKPPGMAWSLYITLLFSKAAPRQTRDRVMMDLVLGRVKPEEAVHLFPKDRGIVHAAVKQFGMALALADETLQRDPDIAEMAVRENGYAIVHVHPDARALRRVALAGVRRCGFALAYLPEPLRADPVIVWAAVNRDGEAIKYASEALRADPALARLAVMRSGHALRYLPAFHGDKTLAMCAARGIGEILDFLHPELRFDDDVVGCAIDRLGRAIKDAAPHYRRSKPWMLRAIASDAYAYVYADPALQRDPEIKAATLLRGPYMAQRVAAT